MWGYSEHQYGVQWRGGQGRASEGIGWLALKVVSIRFMERKTMQWCRAKQCKARFKFSINPSRNWKPLFNFCPNLEFWTSDLLAVRNAYFLGAKFETTIQFNPQTFHSVSNSWQKLLCQFFAQAILLAPNKFTNSFWTELETRSQFSVFHSHSVSQDETPVKVFCSPNVPVRQNKLITFKIPTFLPAWKKLTFLFGGAG